MRRIIGNSPAASNRRGQVSRQWGKLAPDEVARWLVLLLVIVANRQGGGESIDWGLILLVLNTLLRDTRVSSVAGNRFPGTSRVPGRRSHRVTGACCVCCRKRRGSGVRTLARKRR